jgi:hypothetical protein
VSSQPSTLDRFFAPPLALKLGAAGALSIAVVSLVPHSVKETGDVPPVRMLLTTSVLVGLICTVALVLGLRFDLRLPWAAVVFTVGFNALVVLVKFTLAPRGFYDVNRTHDLDSWVTPDNWFNATIAAVVIFVLYLSAYLLLYRFFRHRIEHLAELGAIDRLARTHNVVLAIIAATILLAASGAAVVFLLLIPLAAGWSYLDFVFSSGLSALVGLALAGATALGALAFDSASRRARVVGDASVFVSFFWVGLYFLALYHVLWVVYVLVLTAIWPLKVVTPK